jgi:hypothetical protein
MSDPSLYLYGIIPTPDDAESVSGWSGIKGKAVRVLSGDEVAAVVSDAPSGKLRPRRRNLKAHHDTLRKLAEETTVLPMAFGVLADDEDEVTRFLSEHRDTLLDQIDHIDGQVEVTLRIRWNVDDIFDYFVARYDSLQEMRDAFFGDGASASRQEMIQLGEQFDSLLQAERNAHYDTVMEHLDPVCRAVEVQDPKNESEVLNLACLVPKTGVEAFESAVHDAAESFADEFLFKYTDPMAPYSFADVHFEDGA